jgi:Zn-dependent protease with chaperone function
VNRHPVDVVALVFAIVFLGSAGAWAGWTYGGLSPGDVAWAIPVVLILAGLAGVTASLSRRG